MAITSVADDIAAEILDLKQKIGATILAHYYQEGEIQELADFTGDSLQLARAATKVEHADDRLLRRPLHGRDGQDAQPGQARAAARPGGRLLARRLLPGRQARPLPGDAPHQRPHVPDRHLHQQHRGRQGAVRLGRHLRQRRADHPPRAGGVRNPLRARPAPRAVPAGSHRPADDPVGRLVHGPRDLQRAGPAGAEAEAARRR